MEQIVDVGREPPPIDTPIESPRSRRRGSSQPGKTATRFQVINGFVDFSMASLTRAEIAVWLILWRDTRGDVARTCQADLASRAGTNVRTVRRAIRRLSELGLLVIVHQGGLRRGLSTYRAIPSVESS